jgi:hypothetical protein
MDFQDTIRDLARTIRMRDFEAAERAIDDLAGADWSSAWSASDWADAWGTLPDSVSRGRARADRDLGRFPTLPPLDEPHEREFERVAARHTAEVADPELAEINKRLLNGRRRDQRRATRPAEAA